MLHRRRVADYRLRLQESRNPAMLNLHLKALGALSEPGRQPLYLAL